MNTILQIKGLTKTYRNKCGFLNRKITEKKAIVDINLTVNKGEILGIVGESGCGKSTLSKAIVKLIEVDSGEIIFNGKNILDIEEKQFRQMRPKIQMILQNPFASFNPRLNIESILTEAIIQHSLMKKKLIKDYIISILDECGINEDAIYKYPHEFSGGQLQRISIARALVLQPDLIIADEVVSALDVTIQAQILDLLNELKEKKNLSIIFISHDLAVIRKISDKIIVMKDAKIIDRGSKEYIFNESQNEYTKKLISAIPKFIY